MTGPILHAEAGAGGWQALTLVEQLAHVGSEVERTIRAHPERRMAAYAYTAMPTKATGSSALKNPPIGSQ
jgi:hypothetical protein